MRAAECPGRHRLLDSVHVSHRLQAGWLGEGGLAPGARGQLPFAICTACGYFSSSRVVGLARVCTRRATAGRRRGIERTARGLHPTKTVHEVLLGLKPATGVVGGGGPGVPLDGPLLDGSGTGAPAASYGPSCRPPHGEGGGVGASPVVGGVLRATCKKASPCDRPPANPHLAHGVGAPQLASGIRCGQPAAGQVLEGTSVGSRDTANGSGTQGPPASHSSPAVGSWDPFVEDVPLDECGPPAIHPSPQAELWGPLVGNESEGLGLSEDDLHVFSCTSAWCDFCGLPFRRRGCETVSHLVGDGAAASEGGPQAAGIAACECGGGWA